MIFLLKNHNLRPTESSATHEINAIESSNPPEANVIHRGERDSYNRRGNYRGLGCGRDRGQFSLISNNFENSDKNGDNHLNSEAYIL